MRAYTDGSWSPKTNYAGWGVVVIGAGDEITANGVLSDPTLCEMRQIGGELKAAMEAVKMGATEIYHDYSGVSEWATGKWKTKNQFTRAYKEWMQKNASHVTFIKVAAHSGDKYNDMADKLAKEALGI